MKKTLALYTTAYGTECVLEFYGEEYDVERPEFMRISDPVTVDFPSSGDLPPVVREVDAMISKESEAYNRRISDLKKRRGELMRKAS
jgi:hypothetical protein